MVHRDACTKVDKLTVEKGDRIPLAKQFYRILYRIFAHTAVWNSEHTV